MRARVLLLLLLGVSTASAQSRVSVEAFFGAAHNFGTTLTIEQDGHPVLEHVADYATRPFELPPYYAFRFTVVDENGGWELQFTHHKIHLENNPAEIQSFEISHGYNFLVFGRSFSSLPVDLRVMGGIVIAHPDSDVRNQPLSPGYQLTGPAFVIGAGKRLDFHPRVFVAVNVQLLLARARGPVADGTFSAPNVSLHALFGLGFRF